MGASEGFLGWVAYLGAANAGIPLSIIVKNYGWEVRCPPHLNASHSRPQAFLGIYPTAHIHLCSPRLSWR